MNPLQTQVEHPPNDREQNAGGYHQPIFECFEKPVEALWHSNPATAVESGLLGRSYYHIASDHSEDHFRPSDFSYSLVFDSSSAMSDFFSSSMADVALRLGPYMSISSKNAICTRTEKARKCRQITTNQPSHRPAKRPANPPARLAFRQKKQQTRHTKRGKSPNKNTHKKICQRTQWSDHCITLKNMHTMN